MKKNIVGFALGALQRVRKFAWRFTGRPAGVHALALTTSRRLVLVKLTYAHGWRAPGGGIKRGESLEEAVVRELAEEIGMTSHRRIEQDFVIEDPAAGTVFVLHDVEYRPNPSWEIEVVAEFDIDRLPADLAPRARAWIEQARRAGAFYRR
ncbi:MAG: NUDIX domain-containing protein [Pseudomonadota bacterium]|nr:NUDIX domain-containing protein [Pseudomonadota bacterium]